MKKKAAMLVTLGILFIVILFVVIIYVPHNNNELSFVSSFDELNNKIVYKENTGSYGNYFDIVIAEYKIIPEENKISHLLYLKNISGKDITFNIQIFKHPKLIEKYISCVEPAVSYSKTNITLEMEQRAGNSMISGFLYPYESFSEYEKKEIESLSDKLYVALYFDGKYDYFEVDFTKVEEFSEF